MSYTLDGQELIDGVYYKREDLFKYFLSNPSLAPTNLLLWGKNWIGQVGDGSLIHRSSPVATAVGGVDWEQVSCGMSHTHAIKTDGTLWAWGENTHGELGDGTIIHKFSPIQIGVDTNWNKLSCGMFNSLLTKNDNSLWTIGTIDLAGSTTALTPTQIGIDTDWDKISCGYYHNAVIKLDNTLWMWGNNDAGQLGNNDTITTFTPTQVGTDTNWKQVSCGWSHSLALKMDGTLWTWGDNWGGQLGINNLDLISSPVQTIVGGSNWLSISAGDDQNAAIKTDGSLWMWGSGWRGCLGNGLEDDILSPIETLAGGTDWVQVYCNDYWTLATKANGTVWVWGYNGQGQLGNGTTINESSPIQIMDSSTPWISFAKSNNKHAAMILLPE